MNSLHNSPFYLKPTDDDYLFKVIFKGRFIGHIDERNGGTFIMQTDKIFKKYNAFGLPEELLENIHIHFNKVIVRYNGIEYTSSKIKFWENGKSEVYPEGTKIYLNLRYFDLPQNNLNQLNLFLEV